MLSMYYTAIFHGCKNDDFQMKIFDSFLFLLKDCGYTEAVLRSTLNICLRAKLRKICIHL